MADTPFTGLTASVKVNNNAVAYLSGVDLSLEKEIIEIISFGTTFKEKVPAISDWSASVDGTAAFSTSGSQKVLMDEFSSGNQVTIGVYLDANTYFSGNAYIQSLEISAAPDDKVNLSCSLAGSGAVTLTMPA